MVLTAPRRAALDDRVVAQLGILEEGVEDIEPEAIDAARQPAADHVPLSRLDSGVPPVQLGLADEERVVVELLPLRNPFPAGTAEEGHPIVGRERIPVGVPSGRIAPEIKVGIGSLARGSRGHEPGMLVARVVHHEIEDHLEPALVTGGDQSVEPTLPDSERPPRPPLPGAGPRHHKNVNKGPGDSVIA